MSISAQGLGIKYKEQLTNISSTEGHMNVTPEFQLQGGDSVVSLGIKIRPCER